MVKFILSLFLIVGTLLPDNIVRVRAPQSDLDRSHSYFVSTLQYALDKSIDDYGKLNVVVTSFNASQGRVLTELERGSFIDIEWAGTNVDREKRLLPIRFPLVGGFTGWRVPVVLRKRADEFRDIKTISDLKNFSAIQGLHWPDSDILEAAGIEVVRVAKFEQIYPMLKVERGDCSPRGLQAIVSELKNGMEKEFTALTDLIIRYKFPMYFFVNKKDSILAKRVEEGLREGIRDGTFLEHMRNHPVTKDLFPLSQFKDATIIDLPNPYLPEKTPVDDKKLWLNIETE
jgi:hypothetical protein